MSISDRNTTIIYPRNLHSGKSPFLVVVSSDPKNFEQRSSIRQSFEINLKRRKGLIGLIFLLGLSNEKLVSHGALQ